MAMYLRQSLLCSKLRSLLRGYNEFRQSEQLFVWFQRPHQRASGYEAKTIPLDSVYNCVSFYFEGPTVPHRSKSTLHQKHGLNLSMVQQSVLWRHLCGGWLVLAIHLLQIL